MARTSKVSASLDPVAGSGKPVAKKKSASKPSSPKIDLVFNFEKDTKNTRKFAEVIEEGTTAVVGSLYVQKSAFGDSLPDSVTVTIHSE